MRGVLMPAALAEIKQQLDAHIGEPVTLTTHESRHRTIEHQAVVRDTFRSVFVLDLEQDGHEFDRASFSYTDVLTENIEIDFA
ncbi:MAG TPA: Veg family protein [Weissella thailandensis]|nr:Veg family protein [Weissella thailandensis]